MADDTISRLGCLTQNTIPRLRCIHAIYKLNLTHTFVVVNFLKGTILVKSLVQSYSYRLLIISYILQDMFNYLLYFSSTIDESNNVLISVIKYIRYGVSNQIYCSEINILFISSKCSLENIKRRNSS